MKFPFSDLTSAKLRPALVLAVHRDEIIIVGIFSKVPSENLTDTWILMPEHHPNFSSTGLKKTSLIRTDKIATLNQGVFQQQIGIIPHDILILVYEGLKKSLNFPKDN